MTIIRFIFVSTLLVSHFNISLLRAQIVKPLSILFCKSVPLKTVVGLATLWAAFHLRPAFGAYKMLLGTSVDRDVGSLKANWAFKACFLSGNQLCDQLSHCRLFIRFTGCYWSH